MSQYVLQPDGKQLTGDVFLRLCCINVVMENGSELDRQNPFSKAQQVYEFVTNKTEPQDSAKPQPKGKSS